MKLIFRNSRQYTKYLHIHHFVLSKNYIERIKFQLEQKTRKTINIV